jgi:acetylornithine deacetylase/succinyl-diaminopimelate desuccinylase-like protein
VLHHHIDVVYADRRYWSVDPFGGVIRDGYLYGRGALDMKSTGIFQLVALLALGRARVPLKRDLVYLATADEEAGSRHGALWVAAERPGWLAGAEYALSELGFIYHQPEARAPLGTIVVSEKIGLPLRLTARAEPGHGSMPWPDASPHRLIRALSRLLAAERPPRVLPEVAEYFARLGGLLPRDAGRGWEDVEASLGDPAFRARFLADRHRAAMVRTTFAVTMLRGSEKRNVIPPEAVAEVDCRLLAGDDPDEVVAWVRGVVDDPQVEVEVIGPARQPNMSPPDTDLYKALADGLRRRMPGTVVAPEVLVAFTDNWVFRREGLHGYGWSPLVLDQGELRGIHGNDERVSLENIRAGARAYAETLLAVAGG